METRPSGPGRGSRARSPRRTSPTPDICLPHGTSTDRPRHAYLGPTAGERRQPSGWLSDRRRPDRGQRLVRNVPRLIPDRPPARSEPAAPSRSLTPPPPSRPPSRSRARRPAGRPRLPRPRNGAAASTCRSPPRAHGRRALRGHPRARPERHGRRRVPPVGHAGAALGGYECAVDQDHLPASLGDFPQGPVQARCPGCEQGNHLVTPAADGGFGHVVSAGHLGQALIVPQHRQDYHRDPAGRHDPPPGPYCLEVAAQQTSEVVDGARGQRQTALTDKRAGVLGAFIGFRHTIPTAAGGTPVTLAPHRSGRWRPRSQAGGEAAVRAGWRVRHGLARYTWAPRTLTAKAGWTHITCPLGDAVRCGAVDPPGACAPPYWAGRHDVVEGPRVRGTGGRPRSAARRMPLPPRVPGPPGRPAGLLPRMPLPPNGVCKRPCCKHRNGGPSKNVRPRTRRDGSRGVARLHAAPPHPLRQDGRVRRPESCAHTARPQGVGP